MGVNPRVGTIPITIYLLRMCENQPFTQPRPTFQPLVRVPDFLIGQPPPKILSPHEGSPSPPPCRSPAFSGQKHSIHEEEGNRSDREGHDKCELMANANSWQTGSENVVAVTRSIRKDGEQQNKLRTSTLRPLRGANFYRFGLFPFRLLRLRLLLLRPLPSRCGGGGL